MRSHSRHWTAKEMHKLRVSFSIAALDVLLFLFCICSAECKFLIWQAYLVYGAPKNHSKRTSLMNKVCSLHLCFVKSGHGKVAKQLCHCLLQFSWYFSRMFCSDECLSWGGFRQHTLLGIINTALLLLSTPFWGQIPTAHLWY
jgi:hypothetical protein